MRIVVDPGDQLSFSRVKAASQCIEDTLRVLPEIKRIHTRFSDGAGFHVCSELHEPQSIVKMCEVLKERLESVLEQYPGVRLSIVSDPGFAKLSASNPGVRGKDEEEDTDPAPTPKRWTKPKYNRPACWALNNTETDRKYVEYPTPGGQGIPGPPDYGY
jgi:hypothetical protein